MIRSWYRALSMSATCRCRWLDMLALRLHGCKAGILRVRLPALLIETTRYDRFGRNSSMKSTPASPCQRGGRRFEPGLVLRFLPPRPRVTWSGRLSCGSRGCVGLARSDAAGGSPCCCGVASAAAPVPMRCHRCVPKDLLQDGRSRTHLALAKDEPEPRSVHRSEVGAATRSPR
jgi:hypothetical protein